MKPLKFSLLVLTFVSTMLLLFFNLWAASGTCSSDSICDSYANMICEWECRSWLRECLFAKPYSNWCCSPGVCCTTYLFYCGWPGMIIKGYTCTSYHWACVPE